MLTHILCLKRIPLSILLVTKQAIEEGPSSLKLALSCHILLVSFNTLTVHSHNQQKLFSLVIVQV